LIAKPFDLSEKFIPEPIGHFTIEMTTDEPPVLSTDPAEISHIPLMQQISKAKVLVFGRSGAGKSSLVNRLLNHQIRQVTTGEYRLEPFMKCSVSDIPVEFYDGPGFDTQHWAKELERLSHDVHRTNKSPNRSEHYATVLLVVNYRTKRFLQEDVELAKTVVTGWKLPLAIVLTNFEARPEAYEREPDDKVTISIKTRILELDPRFSTVRYFRVNSTVEEESDRPVAGFERLARGLKELVDEGLEETPEWVRQLRAEKIVEDAARQNGGISGGVFFLPGSSTIANTVIPKNMIIELLGVFEVDGPREEIAGQFIVAVRNGWITGALVVADVTKAIPLIGWVVGGITTGVGSYFQTKDLGMAVVGILTDLAERNFPVRADQIQEVLSFQLS
jgi:predicted GTPase/uncharacterized protein (DUF697 family)